MATDAKQTDEIWAIISRQSEEIAQLRAEVRALKDEAGRNGRDPNLASADIAPHSTEPRGRKDASAGISRSGLLRAAIAAGAGVAGITALSRQTEASAGPGSFSSVKVTGPKPKSGIGVDASSLAANFGVAVQGISKDGIGVLGQGYHGVRGIAPHDYGAGVYGSNSSSKGGMGAGVLGVATATIGVKGETSKGTAGVYGFNSGKGPGVLGEANGIGVKGVSVNGAAGVYGTTDGVGLPGVHGVNMNGGSGVLGEANDHQTSGGSESSAAVAGIHSGSNSGVYGGSQTGAGGTFSSEAGPQLRLLPGGSHLPPGTFLDGAFFVDSDGNLFYYKLQNGWTQLA